MSRNIEVLDDWYQRVCVTQVAHYLSANQFGNRKYWLGIPAVVLATVVGTSVFATLQDRPEPWLQIVIGLSSVAAAVLSALQTFLGYSERAEKHRLAGAKYGALGREMETLISWPGTINQPRMDAIREKLDALAIESPNNPASLYSKAGAGKLKAPSDVY